MRLRQFLLAAILVTGVASHARGVEVDYAREVAPILRAYCAGCHNDADLEGDLSVETHASLIEGGSKKTVRPGDPENSYLIKVLEGRSKPKMPPDDEPAPPAGDVALLKRWIAEGAKPPVIDVSILSSLVVPAIESHGPQSPPITAAAYSPGGTRLAIARYGRVEVIDAASGRSVRNLSGLPGKVNSLSFSPDATLLLAGSGIAGLKGTAWLFDLRTGEKLREFDGHKDVLYDAEFSPDGTLVATAGYDRVIRLARVEDGSLVHRIDVHKGAIFDLAFHPSGKVLASASADETVKLWRVSDGQRLDTLNQPQGEQLSVVFTGDGKYVLAGGADNRIRMWRMISLDEPGINPLVHARFAHEGVVEQIALTADQRHLVSAAGDRSLKLWTLPDLVQRHDYPSQPDLITCIAAATGNPRFLVTRMDGSHQSYKLEGSSEVVPSPAETVATTGGPPSASATTPLKIVETEPNNTPEQATAITVPATIRGDITSATDHDCYRFRAAAGEEILFEVDAAQSKSKLDSKLEILTAGGEPVEQVVLQAQRDSWLTFRGKDSFSSDDFRLHNWREMELNEFLYVAGEVVRLWLYPRGPDSGFKVYPGFGQRHTYFQTSASTHPLGQPCYVVKALPPDSEPPANGLPVYRLHYENDDDPLRRIGSDSRLRFSAPEDGDYLVRVTDVRGFGAATDFTYILNARHPEPGFEIAVAGKKPTIAPGTGKELVFTATRIDGFDGPVRIEITGAPDGFVVTSPVIIESGQVRAFGSIYAAPEAQSPAAEDAEQIRITASAEIAGSNVVRNLGNLGAIEFGDASKLTIAIEPLGTDTREVVIRPGETVTALARIERRGFESRVEFGNDDSGKSLAHGLYVDNIGLNGLMIVEGQTEREFAITAAKWVQPSVRWFFLSTNADGGRTSHPVKVRVLAHSN